MPENINNIQMKAIPKNVFDLILDKQLKELKKKGQKINRGQVVIMLLKESYFKS